MRSSKKFNLQTAAAALLFAGCAGLFSGCTKSAPESTAPSGTTSNRGQQIVDEYLKRDAAPFRKSRIRFTVTEDGEAAKVYEIDTSRKQTPEATTTLTLIDLPAEDKGTGSLTIQEKDKKAVVVTYAASRDEFRETDTGKMFFGGLTAGELLGEWEKYNYKFVGEKDLAGTKALEVDGTLKPDAESVVARINVLFRADNYVPMEMHLFAADGSELRVYKTADVNNDPVHPYAQKMDVENKVYKSRTVIEVLSREFPASIDDSFFTREKLKASVRK